MQNSIKKKRQMRERRHKRVRARIFGTKEKPRCSVFRSSKYLYVQFIDDSNGRTLLAVSDQYLGKIKVGSRKRLVAKVPDVKEDLSPKLKIAFKIGQIAAEKAQEKGIQEIVFDRGGYKYHGRIKALASGLRQGGLKF